MKKTILIAVLFVAAVKIALPKTSEISATRKGITILVSAVR